MPADGHARCPWPGVFVWPYPQTRATLMSAQALRARSLQPFVRLAAVLGTALFAVACGETSTGPELEAPTPSFASATTGDLVLATETSGQGIPGTYRFTSS